MRKVYEAKDLVRKLGAGLVGREVETAAVGDYPGGRAVVTKLAPDPEAPEIAFTVRHPTWRGDPSADGEIGVFEFEVVSL